MIIASNLKRRIRYRQRLKKTLRDHFRTEYLGQLQLYAKRTSREVSTGEIVLVGQDDKKRLDWPLARVVEVIKGKDGKVRVVKVRAASGVLIRPVQRIYPTELEDDGSRLIGKRLRKSVEKLRAVKMEEPSDDECSTTERYIGSLNENIRQNEFSNITERTLVRDSQDAALECPGREEDDSENFHIRELFSEDTKSSIHDKVCEAGEGCLNITESFCETNLSSSKDEVSIDMESSQEECEETFIQLLENGKYTISFPVDKLLLQRVKWPIKKRLERETQTIITVPKKSQSGDVVITGTDEKNVIVAKEKFKEIIRKAKKYKTPPTHFLSIPLTAPEFQKGFNQFKKEVFQNCSEIEDHLFQSEDLLHLTLCVLFLSDDNDRLKAAEALEFCKKQIIEPMIKTPLKLKMLGLGYLRNNPSSANVVYAKVSAVDDPNLLQNLFNSVVQYFVSKGLVKKENKEPLIHVTLLNSGFGFERKIGGKRKYIKWKKIDARKIIEMYSDFDFGVGTATRLDLSIMRRNRTGYWPHLATVSLP